MIQTITLSIGAVPVDVEFEFEPGEAAIRYLPGGGGHPGTPASAAILAVRIGGARIDDPESTFSEWQLDTWRDAIVDSQAGDSAQPEEDHHDRMLDERAAA